MTLNPAETPPAICGDVCNLLHYTIVYRDIISFSSQKMTGPGKKRTQVVSAVSWGVSRLITPGFSCGV